ncbi:folate-binding protein YgfZ [Enterovirga aerilata]|uniref:Folate-binding protein YgfZ n=1 Tax=Enterovirga aerilata TaxID=2730920 RepID=A0A849ILL4_9HYPH|nr:folate-binding protein YgfZ [Enterovirga sp. DB1703]
MPVAHLSDHAVLKVSGPEARTFLDRLVTCDLDRLPPAGARYGALLTPQGKIIADFILFDASALDPGSVFIDAPAACAGELAKRLSMYKLRAQVAIEDLSASHAVLAGWGETSEPTGERHLAAPDPRLAALGWRAVVERGGLMDSGSPADGEEAYHTHRIGIGVPEGGRDFAFNDAFPHEALMDQLAGVDFDKGCYVGQEVVSRMQHRGTARTRIVRALFDGEPPSPGRDVTAADRAVGRIGSVAGERALATLRLDRVAEALGAGLPIMAGEVPIRLEKPGWVHFPYPGESGFPSA